MVIWEALWDDYLISDDCQVKSLKFGKERILKSDIDTRGYKYVVLYKNGKGKHYTIHRLMAIAFIPNPDNKRCVNHKDGNKLNNLIDNLEWCTHSENNKHAFTIGLKCQKLENAPNVKLCEADVARIRHLHKTGKYFHRELAVMFDVQRTVITNIVNYKTWCF